MQELETQITSLLLLCRSAAETPNSVVTLESPETIALRAMGSIAEIKLQRYDPAHHAQLGMLEKETDKISARIKTHRFCAFQDIPIFRKRHCDLGSTTRKAPECCNMNSIPSPGSSLESSNPSIQFPFSSHASSKICLHSALNIVSLLDNLPYPNPTNEIPYMAPPFMSPTSRVEIPRTMPTFACCAIQAGYAILMLCFKARTFNKQSPGGSGSVVDGNSFPSTTLTGFLNELQQNLRLVVRCLSNYSVAFEAIQGMRGRVPPHPILLLYRTDSLQMRLHRQWMVDSTHKKCTEQPVMDIQLFVGYEIAQIHHCLLILNRSFREQLAESDLLAFY